jgi:hypothetical protein
VLVETGDCIDEIEAVSALAHRGIDIHAYFLGIFNEKCMQRTVFTAVQLQVNDNDSLMLKPCCLDSLAHIAP